MTDLPGEFQCLAAQEPYVRSLARTLMHEDADEVVQQTYVQALSKDPTSIRRPREWLARIARNVASNLRRGKARRTAMERVAAENAPDQIRPTPHVPSSAELMEKEERRHELIQAVDRLPSTLRGVIWLRFFENLPPREVARELGVPPALVWERQRRGLEILRRELDAEHGGDRRAWLLPLLPTAPFTPATPLLPSPSTTVSPAPTSSLLSAAAPSILAMTAPAKIATLVAVVGLAALAYWVFPTGDVPDSVPPVVNAPERGHDANGLVANPTDGPEKPGSQPELQRTAAEVDDESWTVRGRVLDDELKPVAGAKLQVEMHAGVAADLSAGYSADFSAEATPECTGEFESDGQGHFRWMAPETGPGHTVTLRFRSLDPKFVLTSTMTRLVFHGEGPPQDVVIKGYALECRLSGLVIDEQERPIADARVACIGGTIRTDAAGAFDTWIPAWSSYQFFVLADGYGAEYPSVQLDGPGSHAKATVKLKVAHRARGRVLDGDGAPIPGARVSTILSDHYHHVVTDGEGRYEVDWLRAGSMNHSLYARKKGYGPVRYEIDFNSPKESYDIVLKRGVRIEGRVLDPAQKPVPGTVITLGEYWPHRWRTIADDEGRFVIEDVPAGKRGFSATAPADQNLAVDSRTVPVPDDQPSMILDIFLAASRSISGTVVDSAGKPIQGVRISVWLRQFKPGPAVETNEKGEFRLTGLSDGEHRFTCFKVGFLRREIKEVADRKDLRITLDTAAFTAGRVIDGNTGEPIPRYRIYSTPPQLNEGESRGVSLGFGDAGKDVKKEDGVWESKYPSPPGSILGIEVRAPGYAPGIDRRIVARVKPDPEQNVMKLFPGTMIRGKVIDPNGAAVPKATIYAITKDQPFDPNPYFTRSARGSVQTDENGEFRLADAPTGDVTLMIKHAKWPITMDGPFPTTAGSPARREIRLPKSATVVGTLIGIDGEPVPGVKVQLAPRNVPGVDRMSNWTVTTDSAGEFRFDNRLAAGSYSLGIPPFNEPNLGNVMISASVDVERGGTHRVELRPVGKCELLVTLPGLVHRKPVYIHISRLLADGKRDESIARWMRVKEGARVVVRGLPPGRYRVFANMEQGKGQVFTEVTESKRASAELLLTR